jgi:hypothetical protein
MCDGKGKSEELDRAGSDTDIALAIIDAYQATPTADGCGGLFRTYGNTEEFERKLRFDLLDYSLKRVSLSYASPEVEAEPSMVAIRSLVLTISGLPRRRFRGNLPTTGQYHFAPRTRELFWRTTTL